MTSPHALVIGYGSSLRRDDAVGLEVAARVAAERHFGVEVLAVHQLVPELAQSLANVRLAIFVDARSEDLGAKVEVRPVAPAAGAAPFAHLAEPGGLLALSSALYGCTPDACWLVTVPASDLSLGEGLSPAARTHVDAAVRMIAALVRSSPDIARP